MTSGAGQPVHLLIRVMRLVRTPEQFRMMLPPVEPINIKVMDDQEEQHLHRQRPGCDKVQGRQMPRPVHRRNDIVEYEDLEKIALDQCIPYQVYPEPLPEYGHPFLIRYLSLQPDKDAHADQQDRCRIINNVLH
ncbi:MAG: hypothetical protein BGO55_11210 [Sphingobacteriales bacterium 50-39]|nr:MAG: hypothetical protein BGO55_11210 [Sphingobacteriales bacterium 50-39]